MSFNAADLVATIRLDGIDKVGRDLNQTRQQLEGVDKLSDRVGKAAAASFKGASVAIGIASVAAGVYVAKLVSAGVAYNTLQQTSRAALRSILGGAEAANAQMDKLDAFARNSPFSKSVFITAQQQLLGFGMEAEKVLPTLDAIQQAVAATGGSSQQLGDIAFVLAQIQSAGKITGQDLMQLGQRGINAADLIGSQMGKTGAEIRESISKGTLDAGEALDALTKGMAEKFAGASANVKETFSGTVDRINAASRDIGAALAEPFVSKNGGGLAVQWGNQIADVMRAVESHVSPVVTILTQRAAPAFADFTGLLDRANVRIRAWDSSKLETGLDKIGANLPAIAGVAGAILGVNTSLLKGIPVLGSFIPAISPLGGILAGIALASPEVRESIGELFGSFKPLVPVVVEVADALSGSLNLALPVVADGVRLLVGAVTPFVGLIAAVPTPVLATVTAFLALHKSLGPMKPTLQSVFDGFKRVGEQIAVQRSVAAATGGALDVAGKQVGTFGAAMGVAGKQVTGLGLSMKAAFLTNPVGLAILGITTAVTLFVGILSIANTRTRAQQEATAAYKDTLDQTTGAITATTEALVRKNLEEANARDRADELGVSFNDMVEAILDAPGAYERVEASIDSYLSSLDPWSKEHEIAEAAAEQLTRKIGDQKDALAQSGVETRRNAAEVKELASRMSEAERSNSRMNEALKIAQDASAGATEQLRALDQALKELNGGTKSQADLTQELNAQARNLADAFSITNEHGQKLAGTLILQNGEIDTTTAAGDRLRTSIKGLNDDMREGIRAADEAAKAEGRRGLSMDEAVAAAEPYRETLRQIGRDAGLSDEQVALLIGTMLDTPEVIATAFIADTDAAELRVMALATQIRATPNGEFSVDAKDLPALTKALETLGIDITTLPEGVISVRVDDGSLISVDRALDDVAKKQRIATIITKLAPAPASQNDGRFVLRPNANANGNLYDGGKVQAFANGGFPTGIYAGRAGGIHKFAEPETRWEAYVSGKPGQEDRNRRILAEAAVRLGGAATFANGGMLTFANGGISDAQRERDRLLEWLKSQMIDWRTDERRGTSRTAAMRGNALTVVDKLMDIALQIGGATGDQLYATAVRSEQAFMNLEQQASAAETQLTTVTDRLNSLKDAAANMAASVATSIRRFFNIGDAARAESKTITTKVGEGRDAYWETNQVEQPVDASSVRDYFASKAAGIKAFADKLVQLQKKGITGALLAEIAELGVENGTPIADALLSATGEDIDAINVSYGQLTDSANQGGSTVADSNFKELIAAAEQQVKAARDNREAIERALRGETDRIIGAITGGLNTQVRAYGGITPMAAGGTRDARIAAGGSNILWAEQGTGGEAYIPFALDRRTRALEIHEEAGRRLGLPARNAARAVDQRHIDNSVTNVNYKAAPAAKPISDQRQLRQAVDRLRLATRR